MKTRWTFRAALRYLAFQVPGTLLFLAALFLMRRWIDLHSWAFWGLIAVWVVKDLVLFPFVWKAYEPPRSPNPMVGARGVAEEALAPSGWVRTGGELWKATAGSGCGQIRRGESVRVTGVRGHIIDSLTFPAGQRTSSGILR